MPDSQELFLQSIGYDSYGNRAYSRSTPEKHRYNWSSTPPAVEDGAVAGYAAIAQDGLSIEELLDITGSMGTCQSVRTALYQLLVNRMMIHSEVGTELRRLETVPDRSRIPKFLRSLGVAMVNVAVGYMLFNRDDPCQLPSLAADCMSLWLSPDIRLRITTHLDDERHRKQEVLELVDEIVQTRTHPSLSYGILFSFFHCAIVSVDASNNFKCTSLMQFLPSFYADLPSTPGITAVATLAYHSLSNPSIIVSDVALPLLPNHVLNQVPVEVWQLIANKIPPMDLRGCAPILGAQFFAAAHDILRHPHIGNHRLVDVGEVEDSTPCTAKGGNFENINPVLVKRRFSVMRRGPSSVCSVVICGQKYAQKGKRDFQVSLGKYSDPDFIRYSIQGGRRRRWRRLQGGSGKGGWHGSRRGRPSMDDPDGNASVSS